MAGPAPPAAHPSIFASAATASGWRILAAAAPTLPSPVAALVGTVTPLQLLTERLARVRGTNPDSIRRDELAYREAASLAD